MLDSGDAFELASQFPIGLKSATLPARVLHGEPSWEDLPGWTVASGEGFDLGVLAGLEIEAIAEHPKHGIWAVCRLRAGGHKLMARLRAATHD